MLLRAWQWIVKSIPGRCGEGEKKVKGDALALKGCLFTPLTLSAQSGVSEISFWWASFSFLTEYCFFFPPSVVLKHIWDFTENRGSKEAWWSPEPWGPVATVPPTHTHIKRAVGVGLWVESHSQAAGKTEHTTAAKRPAPQRPNWFRRLQNTEGWGGIKEGQEETDKWGGEKER